MSAATGNQDTAFTPGPWRVIDDTDVLALEGTPSSLVVAATKFFEGPSTSWERANARLIAAAPELLDLCAKVANHSNDGWLAQQACAIYEKATGHEVPLP